MRKLYTVIFYLTLPFVLLRLYWRGFKAPEYRRRWLERLGFYPRQSAQNVVWFHCVSVGEAEAAFPLLRLMQAEHPQQRFLVTTTTPTGSARVRAVLDTQVEHVYLPYDLPLVLQRFFRHFRPKMAVFMEKEIWPNLFAACAEQQIPLFVINARLSERSARSYQKIPALIKPALECINQIATQTEADRLRFMEIGADAGRVAVLGNIKFDLSIDDSVIAAGQLLKQQFAERFVWILASTHQDEEARLLPVYARLKKQIPQLLLVIAPRHPERFTAVKNICREQGLNVVMRSDNKAVAALADIYIADSMGELKMLYAAADVAFVGGSLVPVGGHNVLEPALIGVPVLFGPQMFNFAEIAERILAEQAAVQCATPDAIGAAVLQIQADTDFRDKLTAKAKAFVLRNQGATRRIADMLSHALR
ncbi:MAG: lipid IV(A) 3-deoxy-D-manno-octulosonic acid transferase [Methylomonas sp.]|jgi:3-deoxy-D-manno-octulosonic-acid transferase|uniref:lipid IV(A) 3-deoxy-D-manno-octulosonic acid transferase n=1 Tax=Methylomonas sp. TaxID=418 RepID=UPI0026003240|nr:lipid IV(A) 3-deoxy-D-manno-octulosonic acid transferase [Methylomonas sp.]MCK9608961.1 lipid IV(A) 3-deoxy-D-manno-octulosonic acid transferase [Methylomonas sp.]